jgi:hypothetical protein
VFRRQASARFLNSSLNLYEICKSDISDQFIFMNDDFFIMKPVDAIPPMNRGTLEAVMERHKRKFGDNSYYRGMEETRKWLLKHYGIEEPLSYGLHIPMVVDRDLMWRLLEETNIEKPAGRPQYHMRTIYGNVAAVGGDVVSDVKLSAGRKVNFPNYGYLSTNEKSFAGGMVGNYIKGQFPDQGPYEMVSARPIRPTPRRATQRRRVKRPVINR